MDRMAKAKSEYHNNNTNGVLIKGQIEQESVTDIGIGRHPQLVGRASGMEYSVFIYYVVGISFRGNYALCSSRTL